MARDVSSLQGPGGRALALAVIDELSARGLACTAANYEVWLAYRLKSIPNLTRAIEMALSAGTPIDQAACEALHERYFAGRLPVQILEAGDSLSRELAGVLASLQRAGDHASAYGETLGAATALEPSASDPDAFRLLVRNLVSATQKMTAQHEQLAAEIAHSAEQVEILKTTLSQTKTEALTDALTGIGNRRLFDAILEKRVAAAAAGATPLSLLLCDIDHFKAINDTWGHPIGDQVIRYVGRIVAKLTPAGATPARYGGEEFAVIMPGATLADAQAIAERMRAAIRASKVTKRSTNEVIGTVTASFGVAELQPGGGSLDLMRRADQCLYAAKRSGRDRVAAGLLPSAAA